MCTTAEKKRMLTGEQYDRAIVTEVRSGISQVSPVPSLLMQSSSDVGAKVAYVQGAFVMDLCYRVHTSLKEFIECAGSGEEKLRFRWEECGRKIGGSPAHAIRCLGPKVSRVSLGAVLPATMPDEMSALLAEFDVDMSYIRRSSEQLSQSLKLTFDDGKHLLVVSNATDAYDILPPAERFDVMLINPGSRPTRRRILQYLPWHDSGPNGRSATGLIGRGDWDMDDFRLIQHSDCVIFMNEAELEQVVRGVSGSSSDAMTNLHSLMTACSGSASMAVTLGNDGSIFMCQRKCVIRVTAAGVQCKSGVGAGDSFAATTCLSLATDAPAGKSCLRGNMEAARIVSGCAPTDSLQRLDEEVKQHPEMIEKWNLL